MGDPIASFRLLFPRSKTVENFGHIGLSILLEVRIGRLVGQREVVGGIAAGAHSRAIDRYCHVQFLNLVMEDKRRI